MARLERCTAARLWIPGLRGLAAFSATLVAATAVAEVTEPLANW